MTTQAVRPPRYATLVSRYPALSHAFVEREVRAARELGAEVHTFSVRQATEQDLLSPADRAEAGRTTYLVGRPVAEYLRAHRRHLLRSPQGWFGALLACSRHGAGTVRATLWQLFYLVEAGVLLAEMQDRGLRHVHVHFANSGADVARAAVRLGRATDRRHAWSWSLAMHGPTEFEDVVGYDLAAKVTDAAFVACITDFCRSQLMRHVEESHWPSLRLVRMSVDAERYVPRASERQRRGPGPLRVLFVGRLVPEKGPGVLVSALERLAADGTAVEAVVVGDGPLREELERRVAGGVLARSVRLLGPVGQDDLPALYEWADVFCLPSFAEGLPVVLMEAMATELPVVTTQIAGIPELVEDHVTGRIVAPGRVDALAGALADLQDGPTRAELGRAARARVVADHLPGPNAERLLELVASAADRTP